MIACLWTFLILNNFLLVNKTQPTVCTMYNNGSRLIKITKIFYTICSTGSDIFLHENPQYFSFDPPMLRHRVSFNANQVQFRFGRNNLLFSCGFMNGDNDKNIFNSTNITVYVQEGTYICV